MSYKLKIMGHVYTVEQVENLLRDRRNGRGDAPAAELPIPPPPEGLPEKATFAVTLAILSARREAIDRAIATIESLKRWKDKWGYADLDRSNLIEALRDLVNEPQPLGIGRSTYQRVLKLLARFE